MSLKADNALMKATLHLLHRAGQVADEAFAQEVPDDDLTPRQYAVLTVLATRPSASQSDLVLATGIDRSTMAEIVKRLLARNLIVRRRSRMDARAYSVKLTPSGADLLARVGPAVARLEEDLLGRLSKDRRSGFVDDLATLVTSMAAPLARKRPLRAGGQ